MIKSILLIVLPISILSTCIFPFPLPYCILGNCIFDTREQFITALSSESNTNFIPCEELTISETININRTISYGLIHSIKFTSTDIGFEVSNGATLNLATITKVEEMISESYSELLKNLSPEQSIKITGQGTAFEVTEGVLDIVASGDELEISGFKKAFMIKDNSTLGLLGNISVSSSEVGIEIDGGLGYISTNRTIESKIPIKISSSKIELSPNKEINLKTSDRYAFYVEQSMFLIQGKTAFNGVTFVKDSTGSIGDPGTGTVTINGKDNAIECENSILVFKNKCQITSTSRVIKFKDNNSTIMFNDIEDVQLKSDQVSSLYNLYDNYSLIFWNEERTVQTLLETDTMSFKMDDQTAYFPLISAYTKVPLQINGFNKAYAYKNNDKELFRVGNKGDDYINKEILIIQTQTGIKVKSSDSKSAVIGGIIGGAAAIIVIIVIIIVFRKYKKSHAVDKLESLTASFKA